MNEMKPILQRWLLAKYGTMQTFTFWKVNAKLYNIRVPFIRGFPSHEWNDTRLLTMIVGQLYEGEKFRFLQNEW